MEMYSGQGKARYGEESSDSATQWACPDSKSDRAGHVTLGSLARTIRCIGDEASCFIQVQPQAETQAQRSADSDPGVTAVTASR